MSNSLKNIHHDKYKVDDIQYANFLWEDCTEKNDVIQDKSRKFAVDLKNIAYTSLYYNNTPMIYVTTPVMTCLWGMNKQKQISLQFTGVENDVSMISFYNFIRNIEIHNMRNFKIPSPYRKVELGIYHPIGYLHLMWMIMTTPVCSGLSSSLKGGLLVADQLGELMHSPHLPMFL